ncbi:hypothetical protein LuPra_05755 [Luteitalea pratensis]|uniref:Uncharacterized protein n=1 Tax=Luteitalea pratensis TaxID=1855912 RepID=A0A143PXG3_LUTPR|nr:P27 family phage terminase small subunit [Luteitalea pratensis]AMY12479.1 hypothetical protein LuPra_05755 [Luteitalea pratensis]
MTLWTSSARDTLRSYCEALDLRDRLQAEIATAPLAHVVTTVDGAGQEQVALKAHPLVSQLRAVRLECRQHSIDLCLSPAAAVRTPSLPPETREPTKWERLTAPHAGTRGRRAIPRGV